MAFEKVDFVQALLDDAKMLRTVKNDLVKIIKDKPNIDKYGAGFCLDKRFSMFETTVSFDSWIGHYGSSSCSTFSHAIKPEEVRKAFIQYLKTHEDEILFWMSKFLVDQANSLGGVVKKELEEAKLAIEKLQSELQEATR